MCDANQADNAVPRPVQAIRNDVTGASAGMFHSVFVTAGGVVFTCGDGHDGRLGHGDEATTFKPKIIAAFVQNVVHAVAVQAGGAHTLVLSDAGEVSVYALIPERTDTDRKAGMKYAYAYAESLGKISLYARVFTPKCTSAHTCTCTHTRVRMRVPACVCKHMDVMLFVQLYSFGCGLGGRLGLGNTDNFSTPCMVAALEHKNILSFAAGAGIKKALPLSS